MKDLSSFRSFQAVVDRLPFHLDETDRVDEAVRRWRQQDDAEAKYVVDLWTYCFIRRYFTVKFLRGGGQRSVADLDALIEQAYARVQAHSHTVADPSRYAPWVSVVCKNTFLNYLRTPRPHISLDAKHAPTLQAETGTLHDPAMVRAAVQQAIARLPEFLQDIARLKFLDDLSYPEIGRRTGRPLPTVRSYVNKVVVKFRSDARLLAFLEQSSEDFSEG